VWLVGQLVSEWDSFSAKVPIYFARTVERIRFYEQQAKLAYPFLESVQPAESLIEWGQRTGKWFLSNGAGIIGDALTWLFLVPILSFVMLKDGRTFRKKLFQLVPNRAFEPAFMVTTKIVDSLS